VEAARFVYPPYDLPLLDAFGGRFESLFVMLHPFIEVPAELAWKFTKQYPSEEQILARGTKLAWAAVAAGTGIGTCAKLNQALLTSSRAIPDELCDFPAAMALDEFVSSKAIWIPGAGAFEPMLRDDMMAAFEMSGQREMIFVPEFPQADPVERLEIARLRSGAAAFPGRGTLLATDESFLFTVDWDSFFTLFYGARGFVEEVVRERKLEGFFATSTTEHGWYNYSLGCCVVTLAPEGWETA